ncbi:MAG TPA: hypothetical protein VKF39_01965 [Nitrososphaerales archaeon]|nr:hypothetical protein [Nitrososphaerales archaeon]
MDGKRTGAGIIGGLLLGLAIIGASGFTTGLYGSFGAVGENVATQSSVSTSVSTSVAVAISSSTMLSTSTGTGQYTAAPGQNYTTSVSSSVSTSASSSVSTQKTSSQPSAPEFAAIFNGGAQSPSHLDNISGQPALVDGVVFLPLLVAVILGAILFRASAGRSRKTEPE